MMPDRQRIPGFDQLRGVAILMVIVRHFYDEPFALRHWPTVGPLATKFVLIGNYGVELFFVLSGFLITSILLATRTSPNYFSTFYARRILRIFPLYYGTLALIFLLLPLFVTFDRAANRIVQYQTWLWMFLSNYPLADAPNWDSSDLFRLGHFWSLCVEEHYYLVWPTVVYCLDGIWLKRVCLGMVSVGIMARVADAAFDLNGTVWEVLQWSTIAKIDGLAIGSWLAVTWQRDAATTRAVGRLALPIAVYAGAVLVALAFIPRAWNPKLVAVFSESAAVLCSAGTILITLQGRSNWLTRAKWLGVLGKYSYGMYVIHNLILPATFKLAPPEALARLTGSPLAGALIFIFMAIAIALVLAAASWELVERRFLALKRYFSYGSGAGGVGR